MADDEFFDQNGLEPEQVEIFLHFNKQIVNELRSDRTHSYDYLQKNDGQSELTDES